MSILSAVDCGTLHYINTDDRSSGWDLVDTDVSTTFETADFSSLVPNGTKGILCYCLIVGNASADESILVTRNVGETTTTGENARTIRFAMPGISDQGIIGTILSIIAPLGIFQYREFDSSTRRIDAFYVSLRGYYI